MVAWRYEISLLLMFQHSQINFVSPRGHVISFTKPPLKHPTRCCLGKGAAETVKRADHTKRMEFL